MEERRLSGAGSGDTACDNRPEWAGLVCRTHPAAAPTSGPSLPDTRTSGYSMLLAPTAMAETSGGVTRTTTTSFLADGRTDTVTTTVTGLASSQPVPATKTVYDPASGLPTATVSLDGDGVDTGRISTGYDKWARTVSYTDTDGAITTTGYDTAGRVAQVTDPKGTTSHGYDGTDANGKAELRGLLTTMTVSGVGSFTAGYDPDGAMTTQLLPGGITQTTSYDTAGEPVGLSFSGQLTSIDPDTGEPSVGIGAWLSWSQENDVMGRVRREWTPAGSAFTDGPGVDDVGQVQPYDTGDALGYDRNYGYDRAARLVTVDDRTAPATGAEPGGCVTRAYSFDRNGNRTGLTTRDPAADGTCAGSGGTTTTWASDTADRPHISSGYVYDELGRTLTLPAADSPGGQDVTLGYHHSDAVHSITTAGATQTFTLDPAGRRATATTTGTAGTRVMTRHYADTSDNPGWITETQPGAGPVITRYAESVGGDLAATITDNDASLTLGNLHGDTVTTITLP
ncbi:MAG: RHS repeat-associated core domain-containing protein, partial [Jiangellaceae bacterium]